MNKYQVVWTMLYGSLDHCHSFSGSGIFSCFVGKLFIWHFGPLLINIEEHVSVALKITKSGLQRKETS